MTQRQRALTIGFSLLGMAIVAAYAIGYAMPQFYDIENIEHAKSRIAQNSSLHTNMLVGIGIILSLDFLVSIFLCKFFEAQHRGRSMTAAGIRIFYTIVFAWAATFLLKNENVSLDELTIALNYNLFQIIWTSGLIVFGFHVWILGVLMNNHGNIPKALTYTTLFAGLAYAVLHSLKLIMHESVALETVSSILTLPMALGELGLAVWLIVRGGKSESKLQTT